MILYIDFINIIFYLIIDISRKNRPLHPSLCGTSVLFYLLYSLMTFPSFITITSFIKLVHFEECSPEICSSTSFIPSSLNDTPFLEGRSTPPG